MRRNDTIDFMKCFAIFFVVCIHTAPFSTFHWGAHADEQISFSINVLARFGVPYFFVISGYLLGQKPMDQRGPYLKKYIQKNMKLLVSWTLFFFVYDVILTVFKSVSLGLKLQAELADYLSSVFRLRTFYYGINEGTSYHLWFLSALIWAMFLLFFFIKINKVKLLLGISLILHLIGLFGQSYAPLLNMTLDTRDGLFFGLFYVTLGFFVSTQIHRIKRKFSSWGWILLFFSFSVLQVWEGKIVVGHWRGIWGNYYLFTIPAVITLFFFVLSKRDVYYPFINKLGANSVGIYVIHPFWISLSYIAINIFHWQALKDTLLWNLLFAPFIFMISYFSYQLLQRLKRKWKQRLRFHSS